MAAYQAEELKQKGNLHFKCGEYESAVSLYSQAIQKNSRNHLLYTNRANARLKLGRWQEVIDDCIHALELSQESMKAYYFLGTQSPCIPMHPEVNTDRLVQKKLFGYYSFLQSVERENDITKEVRLVNTPTIFRPGTART